MSESSGVRNLRAVFEAKAESTSPPSRGRSPIGSEGGRSTSSRPISRIRASFVAVERTGEGGPQIGLRKLSSSGENPLAVDGGSDTKMSIPSVSSEPKEGVKVNGVNGTEHGQLAGVKEEEGAQSGGKAVENPSIGAPSPSQQKELENKPAPEPTISDAPSHINGDGTTENKDTSKLTENLGSVLKGSPFEPGDEQAGLSKEVPKEASKPAKSENAHAQSSDKKSIVEKGKTVAKDVAEKSKAAVKGGPSGSSATTTQSKQTLKPAAINTKKDISVLARSAGTNASSSTKPPASASTASKSPVTPTRQPPSKTSSPRQPAAKTFSPQSPSATKETVNATGSNSTAEADPKKATTTKPSRMSTASNSSLRTKTSALNPTAPTTKKPTTSSSVKPKSPTVPVSLPSRLTAPTASSAAKTSGSSRESLAASTSTIPIRKPAVTKDPTASKARVTAPVKAKTVSRPSMAGSTDETKPRAEPRPADESFLARMMRPTASSANKVHEKVETKSPPRKLAALPHKLKKKSELSGEAMKAPEDHDQTMEIGTDQHEAGPSAEPETTASNGLGITNGEGPGGPEPVSTEPASAEHVAAAS